MPLPQVLIAGDNSAFIGGEWVNAPFTQWSTDTGARWVSSTGITDQMCLWYGDGFFWLGTGNYNTQTTHNLYKSDNGINWTPVHTCPEDFTSYAGIYANGIHVLAGLRPWIGENADPLIQTSSDGTEWTLRTAFSENSNPRAADAVCYGLNKFFVSCYGGSGEAEIVSSNDGVTWTTVLSGGTSQVYGMAGSPTEIVAAAGNHVLRSTNGTTWTPISLPSSDPHAAMAIAYGGGTYVAVGTAIATSTDGGQTWTDRTDPTPTKWKTHVAYGSGAFIAVGEGGTVMTSADGVSWLNRLNPAVSTSWLRYDAFSPVAPRDTFAYDVVFPSDGTTSELRRKVTVSLCAQSNTIMGEDPATPNHQARLRLAQNIITNPSAIADYVMWAIIGNTDIVANGNETSDADVNTAVSAIINVFAV